VATIDVGFVEFINEKRKLFQYEGGKPGVRDCSCVDGVPSSRWRM
jgi:hypothetical protein